MNIALEHRSEDSGDVLEVAPFARLLLQQLGWDMCICALGLAGSGFTVANLVGFGIGAVVGYWGPFVPRLDLRVATLPELRERSRVTRSWFTAVWMLFDASVALLFVVTATGLFFEPLGSVSGGFGLGLAGVNLGALWGVHRAESESGSQVFMVIRGAWYAIGRRSVGTWYRKTGNGSRSLSVHQESESG